MLGPSVMITVYSVTNFAEFSESGDIAKKNRSSWVINMSGRVGNQATVYPNYLQLYWKLKTQVSAAEMSVIINVQCTFSLPNNIGITCLEHIPSSDCSFVALLDPFLVTQITCVTTGLSKARAV